MCQQGARSAQSNTYRAPGVGWGGGGKCLGTWVIGRLPGSVRRRVVVSTSSTSSQCRFRFRLAKRIVVRRRTQRPPPGRQRYAGRHAARVVVGAVVMNTDEYEFGMITMRARARTASAASSTPRRMGECVWAGGSRRTALTGACVEREREAWGGRERKASGARLRGARTVPA
ncbi:hypothetical protein BC628DRAFT_1095197 [Trametes gibbosa]|nr:hypothetical protein BC628DRAFT_1095197 [Trametes gibbosa]